MADETIIADEQNKQVDVSDESDVDDSQEGTTDVETVSIEEFNKLKSKLEKVEGRYKSTQKKIATKTQETKVEQKIDATNLSDVIAKQIAEFNERENFKKEHGEEIYADVLKIKEQHPTLSLEQAMKFSPIANDPARTANPDLTSNPGRANIKEPSQKTIKYSEMSKLSQSDYNVISDKVKAGEIKLIMD